MGSERYSPVWAGSQSPWASRVGIFLEIRSTLLPLRNPNWSSHSKFHSSNTGPLTERFRFSSLHNCSPRDLEGLHISFSTYMWDPTFIPRETVDATQSQISELAWAMILLRLLSVWNRGSGRWYLVEIRRMLVDMQTEAEELQLWMEEAW